VIDDDLDVLVYPEVGMHPDIVALSALRLAPVQCMAWGHPTTSGSPQMDWYISCEAMETADAPSQYRERLALLPGLGTNYAMPELSGEPRRAEFGLPEEPHALPRAAIALQDAPRQRCAGGPGAG
jgi:CRISPR-associated protein Csy1